jgi:uncharacterized lipoprotein YddW (UPF0748 family)
MNLRRRQLSLALGSAGLTSFLSACQSPPQAPAPVATAAPVPASAPDAAASAPATPPAPLVIPEVPAPAAEFRGAWVATVSNIDWPSRPGLPAARQRSEVLALLDRAQRTGLNAIILQVRPAGDAIYPSALEPWSEYLTGAQGKAPDEPAWDPLAFWITQAHQRGLALHAWFNPYRARHSTARSPLAASHLAKRRPELVKAYGDQLWMDPGEPDAAAHTLAVVADVLKRYDVDGVHIDDYFYPYPVASSADEGAPDVPFPDNPSWARYVAGGGSLLRDDWRRSNVNQLVQDLYTLVRRERPAALVGISPFGIGQPATRPAGIQGFSQFHKLYADVELWCAKGWLDYLAPQLYWPIDQTPQAFAVLLDYWLTQVPAGKAVWPGLFTSRVGAPSKAWPADEVLRQIALLRARAARDAGIPNPTPEPSGHIHFSMAALMQDRDGIATRLRTGLYANPAKLPRLRRP